MKSNTAQRLRYLMDVNGYKQVDILNKCLPYAEEYGIKLRKNDIHYYLTGVTPRERRVSRNHICDNVR